MTPTSPPSRVSLRGQHRLYNAGCALAFIALLLFWGVIVISAYALLRGMR